MVDLRKKRLMAAVATVVVVAIAGLGYVFGWDSWREFRAKGMFREYMAGCDLPCASPSELGRLAHVFQSLRPDRTFPVLFAAVTEATAELEGAHFEDGRFWPGRRDVATTVGVWLSRLLVENAIDKDALTSRYTASLEELYRTAPVELQFVASAALTFQVLAQLGQEGEPGTKAQASLVKRGPEALPWLYQALSFISSWDEIGAGQQERQLAGVFWTLVKIQEGQKAKAPEIVQHLLEAALAAKMENRSRDFIVRNLVSALDTRAIPYILSFLEKKRQDPRVEFWRTEAIIVALVSIASEDRPETTSAILAGLIGASRNDGSARRLLLSRIQAQVTAKPAFAAVLRREIQTQADGDVRGVLTEALRQAQ